MQLTHPVACVLKYTRAPSCASIYLRITQHYQIMHLLAKQKNVGTLRTKKACAQCTIPSSELRQDIYIPPSTLSPSSFLNARAFWDWMHRRVASRAFYARFRAHTHTHTHTHTLRHTLAHTSEPWLMHGMIDIYICTICMYVLPIYRSHLWSYKSWAKWHKLCWSYLLQTELGTCGIFF